MRIATAEYTHETNSYSCVKVTDALMQQRKQDHHDFLRSSTGVHSSRGGLIHEASDLGVTLIPTLFASFRPCGPAEQTVYETYRDEMIDALWQQYQIEPFDAIAFLAHGAGIADGYEDVEGDILQHLRARFGSEILIAIALDLHANISETMHQLCDIVIGCKEYPHTDQYESSCKMLRLLYSQVMHGESYGKAHRKLPLRIPSAAGCTFTGPGLAIKNFCAQLEAGNPELLDASVFHGFNGGNVPFAGVSVVTTATTQQLADQFADQIATFVLSVRDDFVIPIYTPSEAMDLALKSEYPTVINESTDNPGSGHPGDGTILLQQMLDRNIPGCIYIGICDPQVAAQAAQLGTGKRINCLLGAKTDNRHGSPISIENGLIKAVSDGSFIRNDPMCLGGKDSLGTTVLLQVGNVEIVVTSIRSQNFDDGPLRTVGLRWQDYKVIGLKSLQHFRAWWNDKAKTIIPINAPPGSQYH